MSHQYFEANDDLAHQYAEITAEVAEHSYTFETDSGVFSKGRLDFGSRLLLETVLADGALVGPVLDLGCGYGPIAIVLADQNPDATVEGVDVSERALALAEQNIKRAGVSNVRVFPSDGYAGVSRTDYRTIVTNPPIRAGKAVVHRFIAEAPAHLADGGALWLVIQKKQGAPSAKAKMEASFGNVTRIALKKGYWILKSSK